MDSFQYIAHFHAIDMHRDADAFRLAREARPRRRILTRLYARLWWASRPRAAAWTPGLLDAYA